MSESPEDEHWLSSVRTSSSYAGLGWQIAGTLVMFVGGGVGLDLWLETMPWLTVVGALVGIASVFALLFRVNAEMSRAPRRKAGVKPTVREGENGP